MLSLLLLCCFLCFAVVQCFTLPVNSMVIFPYGRSKKWRWWSGVRTLFFPHPFPRPVFFLAVTFFPSSLYLTEINFVQWSLPFFFPTHFYHWQCLTVLVPSMVISPPGRSGKWRTWHTVRTLFFSLSKIGSFFGCFFTPPALILFLYNALLFFFTHFLSLDVSLLLWCSVWPCLCLQWWSLHMEGRESDDHATKYVHSFPPLYTRTGLF